MQYCSLQHQTLLSPPNTSTTDSQKFPLWPSYFILTRATSSCPLLFPSSTLDIQGVLIFPCHIFLPFHTVHGVLQARRLMWLDISFPVGHVLSELSTMSYPSWVALHGIPHSFIELDKAVIQVITVFCKCGLHSVCPLMDKDKRLLEAS